MSKIDKVIVCGVEYSVKYTIDFQEINPNIDREGNIHFYKKEICIYNNMNFSQLDSILMHECIHAVIHESGLQGFLIENEEENLCESFGKMILTKVRNQASLGGDDLERYFIGFNVFFKENLRGLGQKIFLENFHNFLIENGYI